jgi:deaminated glutathione amidase
MEIIPAPRRENQPEKRNYMKKIAIAQVQSATDKQVNLRKAVELIRDAKGMNAECIVFPEFLMAFSPASQSAQELAQSAEPIDGAFVASLREAAKSNGIAVLATIYETAALPDRVYDSAVWIDARGDVASVYRKLHLYDAFGFKESDKFHPGSEVAPLIDTGDCRVGMMICYDLRFPEMARMLALEGATVLAAPSGWVQGELKVEHWQTMIKARALENGGYVVAPDQVGNIYVGHSMIVDPLGRTLVDLEEREGVAVVDLDFQLVKETREKLPLLKNRRADVYARYAATRKLS